MDLAGIDLNLLVALDVLVREESVTGAGKRIGLSQPAMSNVLSRLRSLLDDPVLVRTSKGMVPTPRALELVGPVRSGLAEIEVALRAGGKFDPASARARFVMAVTDHISPLFIPRLVSRLVREAPGIDLELVPWLGDQTFRGVQEGRVDLAIAVGNLQNVPAGLYKRNLFQDPFICMVREDHPDVGERLTLETYCALKHVLVSPGGGRDGLVDMILAPMGLSRRVAVVVPTFLTAPFIVAASDMVVTISEWVARPFADLLAVRLLEPPIEVRGDGWFALWHERTRHDPRHRWFRDLLVDIAASLIPASEPRSGG